MEKLLTGWLSRLLNVIVAHGEELHDFVKYLMDHRREIDPADAAVAASMGLLYVWLWEVVKDVQEARDLAVFYVRAGCEKRADDRESAEDREIVERIVESSA